MSVTWIFILTDGTSSCWRQHFFQFRRRSAFLLRWLVFMLPPSNFFVCSLLRATRLEPHDPFTCASPLACFNDQRPLRLNSGSFSGGYTGVVASAWWATLKPIPARLSTTFRDPFRCTTMTLPHWAADTSLLPFLHGGESGRASGRRSGTSSFSSHNTRRFRSTAASQACRTSSPKMNSLVILATNTQVFSGTHPRVSVMKAS